MLRKKVVELRDNFVEYTGDFVEQSIGERLVRNRLEAPVLEGEPELSKWYRVPIEEGRSGDGSDYHIYIKKRRTKNLCIFLSGGGVAWDANMAAAPVTGGRVAAGEPNYYWNNLRPFTQIYNINIGITENRKRNPFDGWNFGVITYSTGDFHLGNKTLSYEGESGEEKLYFYGYKNFRRSMEKIKELFPKAERLLIAGESAGAFATPALAEEIIREYYPKAKEITVFSDSAMLLRENWSKTLKKTWDAPKGVIAAQHSNNITLDWYEALMEKMGDRCKYLYASSTHDYLLSSFQNDIERGSFSTDETAQNEYFENLKIMYKKMQDLSQPMNYFFYDWKNPLYTKGGTVHTAVRQPYYYQKNQGVCSMAYWLHEATKGHCFDVGLNLVK